MEVNLVRIKIVYKRTALETQGLRFLVRLSGPGNFSGPSRNGPQVLTNKSKFAGPKSFRDFRETGARSRAFGSVSVLFSHGYLEAPLPFPWSLGDSREWDSTVGNGDFKFSTPETL